MGLQQTNAKPPRQSNIELLRILAMLGVVILHYNSPGGGFDYVPSGGGSMWLLYSLEGVFICCVDLFVLITGFFSCTQQQRSPGKALGLMVQVIVFQELSLGIRACCGQSFSLRNILTALIPNNYFVTLYVAIYFLSPFLNLLLKNLSRSGLIRLLALCLVMFSLWPTVTEYMDAQMVEDFPGLSFISLNGSGKGYSVVNFSLMYLIGAALRLLDIRVKKRYSAPALALLAVVLTLWGYYDTTGTARAYSNPLVILEAAAFFLFARELHFQSRLVNTLSAGSFTCYLLHSALLHFYKIPAAVIRPAIFVALHVAFTAVTIYLISCLAHWVYHFVNTPLIAITDKLLVRRSNTTHQKEESL